MNDEMKTTTEVSGPWECFSDPCYYDIATLRRKDGPKDFSTGFYLPTLRNARELRDILNSYEARLAPAPEESVTQKGSPNKETPLGTTLRSEEYVLAGDKNLEGEFNTVKEPVPSWRELGPDEVIQLGDEKFVGRGPWLTQAVYIGAKAGEYPLIRFRTRRPLPKQEEMPLEKELKKIEWHQNYSEATIYHALADAIRYLRDEVEKLKYMQDQHTKCLHLTKDEVVKLKEAKP